MRTILLAAIAAAALPLTSTGARAAPWCAHYGTDSGTNCGSTRSSNAKPPLPGLERDIARRTSSKPPHVLHIPPRVLLRLVQSR